MSSDVVSVRQEGRVAIITIESPPVNALGFDVRSGVFNAVTAAVGDSDVEAIVLTGSGIAFSGGADIREFGQAPREPGLSQLIDMVEACEKPVVAAINGVALGGGMELALGAHLRIAGPKAQLGLPEVKLGLLPGAGGTQRLPRLIGPTRSLEIIVKGDPVNAEAARALGIVDAVSAGDLVADAVAMASKAASEKTPLRRVSTMDDALQPVRDDSSEFEAEAARLLGRARGLKAPAACVESVRNSLSMGFVEGSKREREIFYELREGDQSKSQRHLFFAERAALKIPDMPKGTKARPVNKIAVLGAGTMGGGITMSFASAGIPVVMIDLQQDALDRGLGIIEQNYRKTAARGGMTEAEVEAALANVSGSTNFDDVAEADLVIEAVFEDMALKKKIFTDLDRLCKPGAILASNTSTLDINEIASVTKRPESVMGMHFFSPANVMKLLENVRGEKTAHDVLKTAIDIGRKGGKIPVTVGVCHGFVGNRMLHARGPQVEQLLLEGATPAQIDGASTAFGFAMGPCAVGDLAGLDVGWRVRKEAGRKAIVGDAICELGRFGQKTKAGYYLYEEGSRRPIPDPVIENLIADLADKHGIKRREISEDEIRERMVFPLINEGARILEEGIAARSSDIDVIWCYGYGWPIGRGGPMFYADQVGLKTIAERLAHYAEATGTETLKPAPLLVKLAAEGGTFGGYDATRTA